LATKVALEKKLEKVLQQNQLLSAKVEENKSRLAEIGAEKEQLTAEIAELDAIDPLAEKDGARVQAMVVENEKLKQQETEFKESCKKELAELQQKIQ
jgi:SpoVK/Ycf46/Vps4 family AAA+-type ATPase